MLTDARRPVKRLRLTLCRKLGLLKEQSHYSWGKALLTGSSFPRKRESRVRPTTSAFTIRFDLTQGISSGLPP